MNLRSVVAMLLLVVGLVAAFWFFDLFGDDPGQTDVTPSTLVEPFERDAVSEIEIHGGERELLLRRRPDSSDLWDVRVGQELVRADAVAVDELLGGLVNTEVLDHFDRATLTPEQITSFGLAEPVLELTLRLPGEERIARFGERSREGGNVYADRGPTGLVLVVAADSLTNFERALDGMRDRRITDLRTYDVEGLEVVRKGVTTLEVTKDLSQIWNVSQPYKGYAHPTEFSTLLNRVVNELWERVMEDGAQDLTPFGLDEPEAAVHLKPRRGDERVILLGSLVAPEDPEDGRRFALEQGYSSVVIVSKRFADAALVDPRTFRDRSFSRLGSDGIGIVVKLGDVAYELRKVHTDWDIEKPIRMSADGERVIAVLEQIRAWRTSEFLDRVRAPDVGLAPDGDQIIIKLEGGGEVKLLISDENVDGGTYYGQRAGDGGVERVDRAPIDELKKGHLQFKRKHVRSWPIDDIDRIAREKGFGEEAENIQMVAVARDFEDESPTWRLDGPGLSGQLDHTAVNGLLAELHTIEVVEFAAWDATRNEEMGFRPGEMMLGATMTLLIDFHERAGEADTFQRREDRSLGETLVIGKKRPEGGYWARLDHPAETWAFVLSDEVVRRLSARFVPD